MHKVTTLAEIHVKFVRNWYEFHVNECVSIQKVV